MAKTREGRKRATDVAVEVGFALARASAHKTAERWDAALGEVTKGLAAMFGADVPELEQASAAEAVRALHERERVGAFVALIAERADIARRRGDETAATAGFQRALELQRENLRAHPDAAARLEQAIHALEAKLRG